MSITAQMRQIWRLRRSSHSEHVPVGRQYARDSGGGVQLSLYSSHPLLLALLRKHSGHVRPATRKPTLQYPNIRKFAAQIITIFASTYTCEQFFSLMKLTKPRLRAKLSDQNLVAAIRLACSTISPDIPKLVSQKMGNEFHDTSP